MRGDPWGCAKWAKMENFGIISKNGKKNDKKMKRVPDFLLKINAPILHPPHYSGKKNEKRPWGGPRECTKMKKNIFLF